MIKEERRRVRLKTAGSCVFLFVLPELLSRDRPRELRGKKTCSAGSAGTDRRVLCLKILL